MFFLETGNGDKKDAGSGDKKDADEDPDVKEAKEDDLSLAEKKSLDETTVTWLSSCLMVNFDFDPQVIRYENNFCVKRKWKNTKYSYKI